MTIDLAAQRFEQDMAGEWWYLEKDTSKAKGYKRRRAVWSTCSSCMTEFLIAERYQYRHKQLCSDCGRRWSWHEMGTRKINADGYVETKTPDGWLLEHRLVMGRAIGRSLTPSESVHHINGDRSDNGLGNLQLRRGMHGSGVSLRCCDCGSANITPVGIGDKQEPLV